MEDPKVCGVGWDSNNLENPENSPPTAEHTTHPCVNSQQGAYAYSLHVDAERVSGWWKRVPSPHAVGLKCIHIAKNRLVLVNILF